MPAEPKTTQLFQPHVKSMVQNTKKHELTSLQEQKAYCLIEEKHQKDCAHKKSVPIGLETCSNMRKIGLLAA